MAKRERREKPEERAAADYYRLHTKAVEDLVGADESNSPPVPPEELAKYRSGPRTAPPEWVKTLLIKAWFYGAVCFFFLWGLGGYLADQLDRMFILGTAMGVVTDLLVNSLLRFRAETPGANDRWMMVPEQRFVSLFLNILYGWWLLSCVAALYNLLNAAILSVTRAEGTVPLGVEPILFGVFCTAFDTLFIRMKHLARRILADARRAVETGRPGKGGAP